MILALSPWRDLLAVRPLGPKARATSLALGAVLLWGTWPTLATWAQPAPPFLIFALGSAVGFAVSLALASARGEGRAFLRTREQDRRRLYSPVDRAFQAAPHQTGIPGQP